MLDKPASVTEFDAASKAVSDMFGRCMQRRASPGSAQGAPKRALCDGLLCSKERSACGYINPNPHASEGDQQGKGCLSFQESFPVRELGAVVRAQDITAKRFELTG